MHKSTSLLFDVVKSNNFQTVLPAKLYFIYFTFATFNAGYEKKTLSRFIMPINCDCVCAYLYSITMKGRNKEIKT